VVDGTNTVPYLHRGLHGERIVGTVGAGLVPALGTHMRCPYVVADYVTVFRKWSTKLRSNTEEIVRIAAEYPLEHRI